MTSTGRLAMRRQVIAASIFGLILSVMASAKPLPRLDPGPSQDMGPSRVVMETNQGRIVIELYADKAPLTVKNFLQYVDDRHYDGTLFHRVIPNFMIQGGGYAPGMNLKKTNEPIKNEADNGLANERGTLAAARTADPHSAANQFFINVKDNPFLDRPQAHDKVGYAVFGKVVEGMDVVDKIRLVQTGMRGGHADVPIHDVVIISARRSGR